MAKGCFCYVRMYVRRAKRQRRGQAGRKEGIEKKEVSGAACSKAVPMEFSPSLSVLLR